MEIHISRSLFIGPAAPALLAVLLSFAGCAKEESTTVQTVERRMPDQVITGFSLDETAGKGRKEWTFEAHKAFVYEKRNVLEAVLVKVTFFDEAGGVRSVITAREGRIDSNSRDMDARGDVVVTGADGIVLRTESLTWQNKARRIVSEDSVTVIRKSDVLTGWGFRGDPDLGKFEILKGMRATIRTAEPVGGGG